MCDINGPFKLCSCESGVKPTKNSMMAYFKSILSFILLTSFLFACDLKPIDYSKKTRKSSLHPVKRRKWKPSRNY